MSSVYHILYKTPAIDEEEISSEYEQLANELVRSGRMRVDTNYYSNFVRFTDNKYKINLTFSHKEVTQNSLIDHVKQTIKRSYSWHKQNISDGQLEKNLNLLMQKGKKLLLPPPELSLQLARIFVQSAHPIVIKWLLLDKVEVFITYAHNIGDTMSISDWKRSGTNSGMQSTDGRNVAIYTSCGGDPFGENGKEYPKYGNGWAALARMQIIAAQEIGHYADIVRDARGNQITRHSANFSCTKAKDNVATARLSDIQRCLSLLKALRDNGLSKLVDTERKIRFYDQNKIFNLKTMWLKAIAHIQKKSLLKWAEQQRLIFVKIFYQREQYMGLMLEVMIDDMRSHLTPGGDVYKNPNKDIEEAIACAESLARVPQQAIKWGHLTTKATMHGLYNIYYQQVIPSLVKNYEEYTGENFKRSRNKKSHRQKLFSRIVTYVMSKIKPGSKHEFKEVREI